MSKLDALIEYACRGMSEAVVSEVWSPDEEVVFPVLRFELPGKKCKYLGITRELWDHTHDFAQLQTYMEEARWQEELRSAPEKNLTLGESGWGRSEWEIG